MGYLLKDDNIHNNGTIRMKEPYCNSNKNHKYQLSIFKSSFVLFDTLLKKVLTPQVLYIFVHYARRISVTVYHSHNFPDCSVC